MITKILAKYGVPVSMGLILFGIFSLCQPFTFWLYHNGFGFLGIGTILYIVSSKVDNRGRGMKKASE